MTDRPIFALRMALGADAAACLALAVPLAMAAGPLAALTQLPSALLLGAGLALLPWAAFLAWLARQPVPSTRLVWLVIVANLVWVAESVGLLLTGWVAPNALGVAFVLAQAGVAAVLTLLEWRYLPRRQAALA